MCSIFLTNKPITNVEDINRYLKLRGPDHTEVLVKNGLTYIHNLLSINGLFSIQPFSADDVTALFNGEIYNHKSFGTFNSDGECLIPAYRELGNLFPQALDGEFALAVVDEAAGQVLIATDIFGTKPLHLAINGPYFGIATYGSALESAGFTSIQKIRANQIMRISLTEPSVCSVGDTYQFSLAQYRQDFDAWIDAFELAVRKRTYRCRERIFIGLSSGYDSGAISCALNKLGIGYDAYTVLGKENEEIIDARSKLMHKGDGKHHVFHPTDLSRGRARRYLDSYVEPIYYKTYSAHGDYNEFDLMLHDDSGATGLSMVCEQAKADGCKVCLSGQGADEIISDYGFAGQRIYRHSNFGGLFPENLEDIFPWPSFFGSSQESYLIKEEYVAGAYGIETRYPFLDKRVVQEFLALNHNLKNARYKSVLRAYLEKYNYPTAFDMKIGF